MTRGPSFLHRFVAREGDRLLQRLENRSNSTVDDKTECEYRLSEEDRVSVHHRYCEDHDDSAEANDWDWSEN